MNTRTTLPQQPHNGALGKRPRRLIESPRRLVKSPRRLIKSPRRLIKEPGVTWPSQSSLWRCLAAALVALFLATPVRAAGSEIRGPDVTIIAGEERTIYEYRQNGELRMIKVVPNWGKPYYLVPRDRTSGFGDLERAEMLLPSWVLFEF